MHQLLRKTLLRLSLFYAYGLFGAWIFTLIEKRGESSHKRMRRLLTELRNEVAINYNMTDSYFNKLVNKASEAMLAGRELDWNFLNSCGFAFAALTTIGFGNITPKTELGQGITIIFCLLGIPLTMLALKSAGELLASCIRFLAVKYETGLLKRGTPQHVNGKLFLVANTLIVLILVLGSVCSIYIENWSFLEGLYAWFTTFTTIGFGDYIPLESLSRKADYGEISELRILFYGIIYCLPFLVGLTLASCILSCVVDSMDQIRDFKDRCIKWFPSFRSLVQRFLFRKRISYDMEARENHAGDQAQETRQDECVVSENKTLNF